MRTLPERLVTTHLQMTSQKQLRPVFLESARRSRCRMIRLENVDVDYYRFLYGAVGGPWSWTDRLRESAREEIRSDLANPEFSLDVFYEAGAPAGLMEIMREGADFEIVYFGLRPAFHGRGLGKHFLASGVQRAWDEGAQRVWLHTCNLDGPHAMSNYLKRGFEAFRVDEDPMPPWLRPDGSLIESLRPDSAEVRVTWRHLRQ